MSYQSRNRKSFGIEQLQAGKTYYTTEYSLDPDSATLIAKTSGVDNSYTLYATRSQLIVVKKLSGGVQEKHPETGDLTSWFKVIFQARINHIQPTDVNVIEDRTDDNGAREWITKYFSDFVDSLREGIVVKEFSVRGGEIHLIVSDYNVGLVEITIQN